MNSGEEGRLRISGFQAQTSRVWLLSFGFSLAPERSGNLSLVISRECLRFQEGCKVPRLLLCVNNNVAKVCDSVAHIPAVTAWKICSLPRYAKNQFCSGPHLLYLIAS